MPARHPFQSRWNDNDQYGHLNNVVYYEAMDTAVNAWMMRHGALDPRGQTIGLVRASSCEFLSSAGFPDVLEVDLAVSRLGRTSVTWDLAIVREGASDRIDALAMGSFTHVFVDAATRRPVSVPEVVRAAIETELTVGL